MVSVLPSRIMNYRVSAASPTGELLTLGQIFSEVGDYACTILDGEHLSIARKCANRLKKVVGELIMRKCIQSAEDLYEIPENVAVATNPASMSVDELYRFYRCWPIRHSEREAAGREHLTYYYEGRIVRELQTRKAANRDEQLKIDYCVATYNNELDNMSLILSRPVRIDDDKIYPDGSRDYSADELTALIVLYRDYRDIVECEILVGYVDMALDLIWRCNDLQPLLGLITEIVEIGRRGIIRIPAWINGTLEDAVEHADGACPELPSAMLTLQLINGDAMLIQKAGRLINRSYRIALDETEAVDSRIDRLHVAVTCCDYVSGFSARKAASLWNEISGRCISSGISLTSKQIFQLLEVANELEAVVPISGEAKKALKRQLGMSAEAGFIEANAYNRKAELGF